MMSAMPAYAIRKEREKKKSKSTKVVAGRGVYQLRPPRNSRTSISSMKGVYKRPHYLNNNNNNNHRRFSQDNLRDAEYTGNVKCTRKYKEPLYYVGTALLCAGLILVFVSVAINDRNTHGAGEPLRYTGLALLVAGGLVCLIKVLCFSNHDPQNIVFIRRTEDVMMEEDTTTPSDEVSTNSSTPALAQDPEGNVPGSVEGLASDTNGVAKNVVTDSTTLQINGLSPSASSQGACSTQVLITPDSLNSAKF